MNENGAAVLERLAALKGRDRARAVKALTPADVLDVLAELAPKVTEAETVRTDWYDLRKALFVHGSKKGLSRAKLGKAADVSDTAVKYASGVKRSEPKRVEPVDA